MALIQALTRFPQLIQPFMKLWAIPTRVKAQLEVLQQLSEVSMVRGHKCVEVYTVRGYSQTSRRK